MDILRGSIDVYTLDSIEDGFESQIVLREKTKDIVPACVTVLAVGLDRSRLVLH